MSGKLQVSPSNLISLTETDIGSTSNPTTRYLSLRKSKIISQSQSVFCYTFEERKKTKYSRCVHVIRENEFQMVVYVCIVFDILTNAIAVFGLEFFCFWIKYSGCDWQIINQSGIKGLN